MQPPDVQSKPLHETGSTPGINEFIDTDGHDSYYYFDGSNRVTEVAEWTGLELIRFRGHFPPCGERVRHGQTTEGLPT